MDTDTRLIYTIIMLPFAVLLLRALAAPFTWALYKLIPEGRLRLFLFRVRDGQDARPLDRILVACVVVLHFVIFGVIASCSTS